LELRTVFAILKKDVVDTVVHLRLLISIVMPILMSVLFGSLFSGLQDSSAPLAFASESRPAVVVPVYDGGESQIVHLLQVSEPFEVRPVASVEEMQRLLAQEQLGPGLIVPPGFDRALMEGSRPTLQLVVNDRQGDGGTAPRQSAQDDALRAWLTRTLWDRTGRPFPSVVTVETLAPNEKGPLSQRQENMALWLVMSLVTIGVYVVPALLIEEKQSLTLNAVLTTPASYGEMVLAKAGVGLFYGLLASGLILGLNGGLAASAGLVFGAIFLGTLVLVEMGLLLGSLFDDMVTLNTWSTPVMLVLMLPGVLYGLSISGLFRLGILQWIVRLLPTHYLLNVVYTALSGQVVPGRVGTDLGLLGGLASLLFFLIVVVQHGRER
jgi:ABC-type Na+ efflux pump permease subunit